MNTDKGVGPGPANYEALVSEKPRVQILLLGRAARGGPCLYYIFIYIIYIKESLKNREKRRLRDQKAQTIPTNTDKKKHVEFSNSKNPLVWIVGICRDCFGLYERLEGTCTTKTRATTI